MDDRQRREGKRKGLRGGVRMGRGKTIVRKADSSTATTYMKRNNKKGFGTRGFESRNRSLPRYKVLIWVGYVDILVHQPSLVRYIKLGELFVGWS